MEDHDGLTNDVINNVDTDYILNLLKNMISIDSIIGNEAELARYIADELDKLGYKSELDEVDNGRENVYAKKEFNEEGKILTFNGHIDTVEVADGWNTDPLRAVESDNRLFGLGAADMKAGIACQLGALKSLIDFEDQLDGTVHMTAVVDEEGFGIGAKHMMKHPIYGKTDGILIAEPLFGDEQEDGLPLGMTGKVLYSIIVKGKSAHAFRPEKGVNAITDASKIVTAIDEIYKNDKDWIGEFKIPKDKDFGQGSFCVLKIEGGYKKYNVNVPQHCEIILNRLILPSETKSSVIEDLNKLIDDLNLNCEVDISLKPPFYHSYKIDKSNHLVQSLSSSYNEIFQANPVLTYNKMISDANTFMGQFDIPTINFGPKGYNLHGANECVEIDKLEPSTKVMIKSFLNLQKL